MLAYSFYESDARVMRYAESLVQEGAEVDVIALKRAHQPREELHNGVRVVRIQQRIRSETRQSHYFWRLLQFFARSMLEISGRHLKQPYHLVHVHSVPDFEVFAAALPRLLGAKIILDIHDIVPELYLAKFGRFRDSRLFKALALVEKVSAAFSHRVIVANDIWLRRIVERSAPAEKCAALINYPDLEVFRPGLRTREPDARYVILYPGSLNWHQGVDLALRACARARRDISGLQFLIYGEGSARAGLEQLVRELDLEGIVQLRAPVPLREVAIVMANADLGVVPKRSDGFGDEAFSTKILEFMALGVPVVAADTTVDRYYFNDRLLQFFKAGDANDLACALVAAYRDRAATRRRVANALVHVRHMSWSRKKDEYLNMVQKLLEHVDAA
jgi:glycosyltransferase involved in cell wall biosynthesis